MKSLTLALCSVFLVQLVSIHVNSSLSLSLLHTYMCMHMHTLITQGVFLCSVTKNFIHFTSSRLHEA